MQSLGAQDQRRALGVTRATEVRVQGLARLGGCLFLNFWPEACEILLPQPELNSGPLHWKVKS